MKKMMELNNLTITDLFLYKQVVATMIADFEENQTLSVEDVEELYNKLDRLDDEIFNRVDSI